MTARLDSIPIRVAPLPGEAIDSWLEATARRLDSGVSELLGMAAIRAPRFGALGRTPWTSALYPRQFSALSTLTGLALPALDAMTLAMYDGRLLEIDPATGRLRAGRWWLNANASRFCPRCLAHNGGRWMLCWRLPWVFACTRHRVLLADQCPRCRQLTRARWWYGRQAIASSVCRTPGSLPAPRSAAGTRLRIPCGYDLTQTPCTPLPADGLILAAQQRIHAVIEAMSADDLATAPAARSGELDELYVIARSALGACTSATRHPAAWCAALAELAEPGPIGPRIGARPGPRHYGATATAAACALAHHTLAKGEPDPEVMRWLARHEMRKRADAQPGRLLTQWAPASPALQDAILKAAAPLLPPLRPSEQLRYRLATSQPRRPVTGAAEARVRMIPTLLWRGWALRLIPPDTARPLWLRTVLSTLILLVGESTDTQRAVRARIGLPTTGPGTNATAWMARHLHDGGSLEAIVPALSQLAINLDEHGAPINYARRRALFSRALLDTNAWNEHCDELGINRPSPAAEVYHRLRLIELLTGTHPKYLPAPLTLNDPGSHQAYESITRLRAATAAHLHHQARTALARVGIDEPVEWEPPFTWTTVTNWPGPHPEEIDAGRMWQLIHSGLTPGQVAAALHTTIDHVRYAAATHPDDAPPTTPGRKIARAALPSADELRHRYAQGESFTKIADSVGCSDQTIMRLALGYGITPRPGGRPGCRVDPAWLKHEYETERRTLADIAAELGTSPTALERRAHRLGLHVRAGGSGSKNRLTLLGMRSEHTTPTTWNAFFGPHAELRITRFLAAIGHRTFTEAAQALGIATTVLTIQITKLERDTGLQLVERDKRNNRKPTFTKDGENFAAQARPLLARLAEKNRELAQEQP